MKRVLISLVLVFACTLVFSQNDQRIAKSKTTLSDIEKVVMPPQDNAALLQKEMQRRGPGIAPRFAVNMETNISPNTHGTWERLANGNALWRLWIISEGAKSLNLGFTKYLMPRGGSLILYSPDKTRVMGPFTPADNEEHEQLWTPVLDGDELVVEVQVPAAVKHQLQLELKFINHDFVGFSQMASGSCNLDVICGGADGWEIVDAYRDIIQSVAVIGTGGNTFCTGFLVNNARQDCTPYFMTANHCNINSGNAPSLVAYWNYFNSTCRQPSTPPSGANGNGTLNDFNSGSIWRAGWGNSDFTLVELDDPVSETADAFFAGWSAEDFAPTDTVITIHHPNTQEKRISFEFDPTFVSTYNGSSPQPNGNHITVPDWDIGTTEGGSSGAPLFNRQKRVVGQLHGGFAACGNNSLDSYGWFHTSWEGNGTPTSRLKDWLDPDDTGIIVLDGRAAMQCSFFVTGTPATIEICAPDSAQFMITVSPNFQSDVELSVDNLPMGLVATFDANPIMPGDTTFLTISNTSILSSGDYTFSVIGADSTESNFSNLTLNVTSSIPTVPAPVLPADGALDVSLFPLLTWEPVPVANYAVQVATDPDFTNQIINTPYFAENEYQVPIALQPLQLYYWRVQGNNTCGSSEWSEVHTFTTASIICASDNSLDVPILISENGEPVITSTLQVTTTGPINDVNVNDVVINHTWVSDIRIELTSPSGTTIELLNNVGGGDCEEDDIAIGFDDQSPNPYALLDGLCDITPPALSGVFQPSEPLSTFAGEEASGVWTLTVFDDADFDGGSLENWALEICTIIPNDNSVTPTTDAVENCINGSSSFTITLGAGFDGTDGVSLSANGLPAGATATFDPNPAQPASQVEVTLEGAADSGVYDVTIVANDGTSTGTTEILWTVSGGPDAPVGIFPGTNTPINVFFEWSDEGADEYLLTVSTDPNLMGPNIEISGPSNSTTLTNLEYCTTYYWQVASTNECGTSSPSPIYSFTTADDLSFTAAQIVIQVCNVATISIPIAVGDCFETGGLTLSADGLPMGATVNFPNNPVFSNENVEVDITLTIVSPGSYDVVINGTDGVNNVSATVTLEVDGPAAQANLQQPANNALMVSIDPTLTWSAVAGATSYKLELATDGDFNNIVYEVTQPQTSASPPVSLAYLTVYYWRVTAFNDCGGSTTAPFSFTTEMANALVEVNGQQLEILPNPTSGLLQVVSSAPLNEKLEVKVFTINGVQLMSRTMQQGAVTTTLDLTGSPSGIYLLQMSAGNAIVTERIVLK